jgi:hypothetical protein
MAFFSESFEFEKFLPRLDGDLAAVGGQLLYVLHVSVHDDRGNLEKDQIVIVKHPHCDL